MYITVEDLKEPKKREEQMKGESNEPQIKIHL